LHVAIPEQVEVLPLARQQTKWLVAGVTLFALVQLGYILAGQLVPVLTRPGLPGLLYQLTTALLALCFLLIPAALAIAILRFHLWDIDLIIRRTLQYSLLTATLTLIYVGSVALLQLVFRGLTGQAQSQFVTVISTLVIAVLFTPLRHRI
jgi:hypothetical protein